MKITVNARTAFALPTGLVVNRLMAGTIRKRLKKEGIVLSKKQTVRLIKEFRRYKKKHADWNLVEVNAADGDTVTIRL